MHGLVEDYLGKHYVENHSAFSQHKRSNGQQHYLSNVMCMFWYLNQLVKLI